MIKQWNFGDAPYVINYLINKTKHEDAKLILTRTLKIMEELKNAPTE
jgi:hypothetical protein